MITVTNLKKRYGEFSAVDGLSFEIHKNEIFGILGPNGAGKTTTLNMICGLLPPSEGAITYNSLKHYKSFIGYCPQENIFYPNLTCYEQLMFIGHMYGYSSKSLKLKTDELLGQMGLNDKKHVRAVNLSGGMKRRLNICLALIHDPEILILDEPEAGLDPQSRIMVREFIKDFAIEKTIILSTHNMDEADRLADRIAIIDYGKLLLLDTPGNLKRTVGEVDILEIVFENGSESTINLFAEKVTLLSMNIIITTDQLLIKYPNIIDHLPEIKNIADNIGLKISEIKFRENTLEDVFIHLTGRNLRE